MIGGLIGLPALHFGKLEIGLSKAVGALLGGLVAGWLRSVNPRFGRIPEPALWIFDSLGLNVFIGLVGLSAGPEFVQGLRESGLALVAAAVIVNATSLVVTILVGRHLFRLHPGVLLGVCAGAATSAPALAARPGRGEEQDPDARLRRQLRRRQRAAGAVGLGDRRAHGMRACAPMRLPLLFAVVLALGLPSVGCKEHWDTPRPLKDEELETAFFSGLNSIDVPDLPEPRRLRPCCIFGDEVGVGLGPLPVPGYEVSNVLGIDDLGTHVYNHGALTLQPLRAEGPVVMDEASGILYTCRGGFIDIAHVRDNADRTLYLAAQIGRLPATGGTIPLVDEGAERRIVVHPLDAKLVRAYGIREVVTRLAEWLDFQASIWHEIATWYRWSSTAFSEQPSAFSPEDLYSNLLGLKIAGEIVRRHDAGSEEEYDRNLTALLQDALDEARPAAPGGEPLRLRVRRRDLVGLHQTRSRQRAGAAPQLRHRLDALPVEAGGRAAFRHTADEEGGVHTGLWRRLDSARPERPRRPRRRAVPADGDPGDPARSDIFSRTDSPSRCREATVVTQDDFPALIEVIRDASEKELGPGAGVPAARPNETSRDRE